MSKNSEVSLVTADAFVMFYDSGIGKWMASGSTDSVAIAKVQILQNLISNQFKIFAWNPNNKEVLVTSVIYHNLRYQKAHATFHEWRDTDTQVVYGIHFADSREAGRFGDVISKIFASLEVIYKQCKELQETIRSQSVVSQSDLQQHQPPPPRSPSIHYGGPVMKASPAAAAANVTSATMNNNRKQSTPSISYDDGSGPQQQQQQLPNYENIHVLLKQHQYQTQISDYGSVPVTQTHRPSETSLAAAAAAVETRCQSSSDDSVRGLRRQPSSASSGYATVASLADQYSPASAAATPGQFMMDPNCPAVVSASPPQQAAVLGSRSPPTPADITTPVTPVAAPATPVARPEDQALPRQTSFAAQLQSAVLQRKKDPSYPPAVGPTGRRESAATATPSAAASQGDDIMSEMRRKLQKRKQLIDGNHDDQPRVSSPPQQLQQQQTHYSSDRQESEVAVNSTASSNSSSGAGPGENRQNQPAPETTASIFGGSKLARRHTSDMTASDSNKTLLQETGKIVTADSFDEEVSAVNPRTNKNSLSSDNSSIQEHLERIKTEIIEGVRKEIADTKRDIINAIRMQRLHLT